MVAKLTIQTSLPIPVHDLGIDAVTQRHARHRSAALPAPLRDWRLELWTVKTASGATSIGLARHGVHDLHRANIVLSFASRYVPFQLTLTRPKSSSMNVDRKHRIDSKNLGASSLLFTSEDLQALEEVSKLPPEYPAWMPAMQGHYRAVQPDNSPKVVSRSDA